MFGSHVYVPSKRPRLPVSTVNHSSSAVETSSSRFDPQLSLDEYVHIRPTPLLEASLLVPPYSSSSQPLGLTQGALESSSLRLETSLSSLDETLFLPASSPEASKCHSPHSSPLRRPPELMQDNSLSDSLEDSLTIHAHPHSTPLQRPPRIMQDDSVPIALEDALAPTSPAVPLIQQQHLFGVSLNNEVSSAPESHPPFASHQQHSSSSSSDNFNFALTLVALTALVSTLLVISSTLLTHPSKFWRNNKDIGNDRNGTTIPGQATPSTSRNSSSSCSTSRTPSVSFSILEV